MKVINETGIKTYERRYGEQETLRVWDLPLRVFHIALILFITASYISSLRYHYQYLHMTVGLGLIGLVLFRLIWGFCGNGFARFTFFIKSCREVRLYVSEVAKTRETNCEGHNPLVGWMVFVIISIIVAIIVTGLISYDYSPAGAYGLYAIARGLHTWLAWLLMIAILIHITAAFLHEVVLGERVIGAMITGKKKPIDQKFNFRRTQIEGRRKRGEDKKALRALALTVLGVTLVVVPVVFFKEAGRDFSVLTIPPEMSPQALDARLVTNKVFIQECASSCHGVFHPSLLPYVSWHKITSSLEEHFGEDASIDNESLTKLNAYLMANSAGGYKPVLPVSRASLMIINSIEAGRSEAGSITETLFWKKEHSYISDKTFGLKSVMSRANCQACHLDADYGLFRRNNIYVPEEGRVAL